MFVFAAIASAALGAASQAPESRLRQQPSFASITSPAPAGSAQPNLATDASGRVWLSWLDTDAAGKRRFRIAALKGTEWSAPITVMEGDALLANWADFPSVFVTRGGTLAAHWLERGPSRGGYGIRMRTSSDQGRTWSAPVAPHTDQTTAEHGFVSFFEAPGANGLGLVWLDGRDAAAHGSTGHAGGMALRSSILGNSASAESVVDARVCDCCQTSAATTSDGVIVAYRDRSEAEVRDISVVRLVNGRWSAPATVHADGWTINGCPVNGPAIAASGRNVAIAWFTMPDGKPHTRVAFSSNAGQSFGKPIEITGDVTLGRLGITMFGPDRALVSSIERKSTGAALVVRKVFADGYVGSAVAVADVTSERASGFPRIVMSGTDAVIAWTEIAARTPPQVRVARGSIGANR